MAERRLWLGGVGVLLAAAAVAADSRLLGWLAAVVLAAALLLRIRARRTTVPTPDDASPGLPNDG